MVVLRELIQPSSSVRSFLLGCACCRDLEIFPKATMPREGAITGRFAVAETLRFFRAGGMIRLPRSDERCDFWQLRFGDVQTVESASCTLRVAELAQKQALKRHWQSILKTFRRLVQHRVIGKWCGQSDLLNPLHDLSFKPH